MTVHEEELNASGLKQDSNKKTQETATVADVIGPDDTKGMLAAVAVSSAIAPGLLEDAKVEAVPWLGGRGKAAIRKALGFSIPQLGPDQFPVACFYDHDEDGHPLMVRTVRFNAPVVINKKEERYRKPYAAYYQPGLYVPPAARRTLDKVDTLYVVEGEKKTLGVLSQMMSRPESEDPAFDPSVAEFSAVGLSGVSMYRGPDGKLFPLLAEWAASGRRIVLVFDADTKANGQGFMHRQQLAETLVSAAFGAGQEEQNVFRLYWHGNDKGIDDYLASEKEAGRDPWESFRKLQQKPAVAERDLSKLRKPIVNLTLSLNEQLDAMVAVLAPTHQYLRYGEQLVRVDEATGRVRAWTTDELRDDTARVFRFHGKTRSDRNTLEAKPYAPDAVLGALKGRTTWPEMIGLVGSPCLRPDRTLLDTAGFDVASSLVCRAGDRLPEVEAPKPGKGLLWSAFRDFGYVDEALDYSCTLALLMTIFARHAIDGSCPGFLVNAVDPGSGKTLLCNIVRIVAEHTPRKDLCSFNVAKDETEGEKKFIAALRRAPRTIVYGNIPTHLSLEGQFYDEYLTGSTWAGRLLGQSETLFFKTTPILIFNGNNVDIRGDMHRRLARIQLKKSNAKRRRTETELYSFVWENRHALLGELWAFMRDWDGRPVVGQVLLEQGSLTAWVELVSGCLTSYGYSDPFKSQSTDRVVDAEDGGLAEAVAKVLVKGPNTTEGIWTGIPADTRCRLWPKGIGLAAFGAKLRGLRIDGRGLERCRFGADRTRGWCLPE